MIQGAAPSYDWLYDQLRRRRPGDYLSRNIVQGACDREIIILKYEIVADYMIAKVSCSIRGICQIVLTAKNPASPDAALAI